MKNKLSKAKTEKLIGTFFENIKKKSSKEIRKIQKIAMHKNISLKNNKKLFCKKCLTPYKNPKIRIKKARKIIQCENCNYIARWKL